MTCTDSITDEHSSDRSILSELLRLFWPHIAFVVLSQVAFVIALFAIAG